ncbi:hypothetical protein LEP1GSC047_4030 [Leptospira inadai serovar Lyme str. 10]|uniref:Uncharacterized protein n=2 Tax=Leptospira inadai serovar Lyme TaxID=293084 RepID=V6HEH7_9LEPT|nr:hypothetical protein [Leptospira inadai]EQA37748.1 hypothetical protein LEP1GSC047_4030 [Leptospira inadai serovar Lyme str. 10]PNV71915.1 hypothetical protein BES34_020530 [Leptospira inadai serovar Lyme]
MQKNAGRVFLNRMAVRSFFSGILFLALFVFTNCQNHHEGLPAPVLDFIVLDYVISQDPDRSAVYFSTVRNVGVEVAYETGATPEDGTFTGTVPPMPVWEVTRRNLENVFANRGYSVSVSTPSGVSGEMQEIPSQGKDVWSVGDLVALASKYRRKSSDFQTANFFVVFVNGKMKDSNIIAITISGIFNIGAPAVFVFKDIINTFPAQYRKSGEQSTVVHELGHAVGLVNNGIPMQSSHQDLSHGAHCTNKKCTMYYSIQLENFNASTPLIYGDECIGDIRNYKP